MYKKAKSKVEGTQRQGKKKEKRVSDANDFKFHRIGSIVIFARSCNDSGISRDIVDRRNHIHYVQDYTRTS